jgi:hypothetical protein
LLSNKFPLVLFPNPLGLSAIRKFATVPATPLLALRPTVLTLARRRRR